jgi:hypothetical protein
MFRGVRNGGIAFQPNIEVDSGNLGIGVWGSTPIRSKVPGVSDPEIDPYVYYTFTVNDSISIVPTLTYYGYPNADTNNGFYAGTFEPNIAFNYTISGVKLTPKFYYDTVLESATCEFSVAYAVPLKNFKTELDFAATVGTFKTLDSVNCSDPKTKNYGNYVQFGVSAPFAINDASKFIVGVAYANGTGNYYKQGSAPKYENTAAVGRVVVTLSCSFTF